MLAGALSNVEIGDEIPAELYKAVAEVLVFVLRLSGGSLIRRRYAHANPSTKIRLSLFYHDAICIVAAFLNQFGYPRDQSPPCARSSRRRQPFARRAVLPMSPISAASSATIWPSGSSTLGTDGTFVGYKVDDYLIIASDKDRSGEGKLPASTFKIPNSLIALETGVVADPDKDVFKWDGVTRSIEAWNKDHTLRSAIAVSAVPVYQEIARRIGAGADAEICRPVRIRQPRHRRRHRPVLADRQSAHRSDPADRFRRPAAPRRAAGLQAQPGTGARYPAGDKGRRRHHPRQERACWAPSSGKPSLGWMVGWAEKGSQQTVFAMNMDCKEPSHIAARMTVTQQCLADIVAY